MLATGVLRTRFLRMNLPTQRLLHWSRAVGLSVPLLHHGVESDSTVEREPAAVGVLGGRPTNAQALLADV
jgi:hypothetical protein